MSLPADHIEYRIPRGADVRVLKKMRRFGLRSPRDHWVVEALRIVMIVSPLFAVALDLIRMETALAILLGYLLARKFDHGLRPWLLNRIAPLPLRGNKTGGDSTVRLDAGGIKLTTDSSRHVINWSVVVPTRVGSGFVFRIAPQTSVVLAEDWLPDGWTVESTRTALTLWSGQEVA